MVICVGTVRHVGFIRRVPVSQGQKQTRKSGFTDVSLTCDLGRTRKMAYQTFQQEYLQMPVVTRTYTTACVVTTLAVVREVLMLSYQGFNHFSTE